MGERERGPSNECGKASLIYRVPGRLQGAGPDPLFTGQAINRANEQAEGWAVDRVPGRGQQARPAFHTANWENQWLQQPQWKQANEGQGVGVQEAYAVDH